MKRYLITTADEDTWKFDRPVIFLGEWCLLYDRKHIWQDMDAVVACPYGLAVESKDADFSNARDLESRLFADLYNVLNQYHQVKYSERFWKIILGHWLRRCVDVVFNRVRTLEECANAYQLSGISVYDPGSYSLMTSDSYSSILAFDDDVWNHELNVRILDILGIGFGDRDIVMSPKSRRFRVGTLGGNNRSSLSKKLFKRFIAPIRTLSKFFVRDSDSFILNSYLPKHVEFKLQIALGQFPQFWSSPKLDEISDCADLLKRRMLSKEFMKDSNDSVEMVLRSLLFEMIPICYLEGFNKLNYQVKNLPWPKSPKFIFTSNNFDTDDLFKLWAAKKIENGSKYYLGQHGNNYGTHRYITSTIEETTSDKFLTWGWTDGLVQHTPAFILKLPKNITLQRNSNQYILLFELHCNHRFNLWDCIYEFKKYFEDQVSFVCALAPDLRNKIIVRLHSAHRYFKWSEIARWQSIDPTLHIDSGSDNAKLKMKKSRLVVYSYDSTGILETLSQNVPTIAFWPNGLSHLRDNAKTYYQMLVDVGILHLSPESAASKVEEVWGDVDGWWMDNNVQVARKIFCDRFARNSKNPIKDLMNIFTT